MDDGAEDGGGVSSSDSTTISGERSRLTCKSGESSGDVEEAGGVKRGSEGM